jgi:hypothetical protein
MPIESALQHLLESTVNEHPEIQNAVLSIHTPTLAWSGAAGDAQRDPLIPMQPQTQFRSASIRTHHGVSSAIHHRWLERDHGAPTAQSH